MPTINQLSQLNTLSGSDQLPVYSASNGDARKASLSALLAYIEANFASPQFVTQYASPNANGSNVTVASATSPTWLILTPTGPFATMTITLPPAAQVADGTELLVFCSQAIATLTFGLNGATGTPGAPTTLFTNDAFTLRYNAAATAWYCVAKVGAGSVTQSTFTPTFTSFIAPVNTAFAGRYTLAGSMVTVELEVLVGALGSFVYDPATDYFTGLPTLIQPPSQQEVIASTPQFNVPSDPYMVIGYAIGWRLGFVPVGPSFTILIPGSYRWNVTYLI